MNLVYLILLTLGLVCFAIDAFAHPRQGILKWNWLALGLMFWIAVPWIMALRGELN
jgi:hypothetical protein